MAERRAPAQMFFENIPKVSIITALTYLIVVYINAVSEGALSAYADTATTIMLFGAVLAVPAITIDVAFTGTLEPAEAIWVGFINFFALLTEYALTNWDQFSLAAMYVLYIYAGLFIISLVIYVAVYYARISTRRAA